MQEPVSPIDAVTHRDPYGYYRQLREQQPLHYDESLAIWVASSFAVVDEAFRALHLRVRPPAEPVPTALAGTFAGEVFGQLVRMNDGEFHARHKPVIEQVTSAWSPERVARAGLEAAQALLPTLDANDFLTAVPVRAVASLLGVGKESLEATTRWVHRFVQGIAPGAPGKIVARASEAARALMEQGAGVGLSPVQAANRLALMQQSLDATAGLLGNAAVLLVRQPDIVDQIGQSHESMRQFVAEVARWDSPVQNTRRYAAQDTVLAGRRIATGQAVLLVVASANRDEALNPNPDNFDPRRADRRSLTFGAAAHACPGAALSIDLVAATILAVLESGRFTSMFGRLDGYRPSPNARIPVFQT